MQLTKDTGMRLPQRWASSYNRVACLYIIPTKILSISMTVAMQGKFYQYKDNKGTNWPLYGNMQVMLSLGEAHSLWTSGTKCLYCVSNLSNLGLKLLKKISILSQTCLGQNVSIWSQCKTFLTFETQLRLPLFESNLRAIWDIFLRCQKGVKKVSKISQKGIWGI